MQIGDNILIVCTYTELAVQYKQVLEKYKLNIDIEVMDNRYGKDMSKVLDFISSFREKGKEIIISRGFLARQIRSHLDFRVIEIHINALDVIRALYPYVGTNCRIGIVESEPYLRVAQQVAKVLNLDLKLYEVVEMEDFETGLQKAKEDQVDVVVGGAWHSYDTSYFEDYGIPYAKVESSLESIENSLQNAIEIYKLTYAERKRKELLETMVALSDGGFFAVDEKGEVLLINNYCMELLDVEGEQEAKRKLEDQLSVQNHFWEGQENSTLIEEINGEYVLINRIPLWVGESVAGMVLTMKKASKIQEDETLLRAELTKKGLRAKYTLEDIHGKSKIITELKKRVERYAATQATVLISGESGTGKELFAQAVHNCSLRRNKPFVAVNCSALSASLLESELFGYVDGAFTGAKKGGKIGVFELAHTGTLFLDEIGEMDLSMQTRLLRVLQEKEIMRIGDNKVISVDVRIVAATNRDLYQEMEMGRFREDLFYRLNLLDIRVPSLRERSEDIPDIATAMIPQMNQHLNCHVTGFSEEVLQELKKLYWRGNIRELRNVLEKMAILTQFGVVKMQQVSFVFQEMDKRRRRGEQDNIFEEMTLVEAETLLIRRAMEKTGKNQTKAAALLGIDRTTLRRKWSELM